jgi:hypothetical protein
MVRPERFELPTLWFVAKYSIQLSYGRTHTHHAADAGSGAGVGAISGSSFGNLQTRQPHQLRHRRRIQPRRVKLHPQRALFLVDADAADPINIARARQRKASCSHSAAWCSDRESLPWS